MKWDPMQSQRWTSEVDTATCLGGHKAKWGTDFHSQCLCYGTAPHGTTRLSLTDLGITGYNTNLSFTSWHFHNISLDEELLAIWERQELRSSISASENYIPFLIWNLNPDQPPSPSKAGHNTRARKFFLGTDGNTVSTLVVLNSNTQQQHTDYKPWESSVSSQRTVNSNIYPQVHRHICIQVTYKQQQSELHLQLDTSVVSIMCDDQDLQVPKLLHPGHPNLLCYNVWEERTFQLFSHHYMKA